MSKMDGTKFKVINNFLLANRKNSKVSMNVLMSKGISTPGVRGRVNVSG